MKVLKISIATALALFASLGTPRIATGNTEVNCKSKWTVTLETREIRDKFIFKGSNLRNLVKVDVKYAPQEGAATARKYEDIWLKEGKPLGLERYEPLSIPGDDDVTICVAPSSCRSNNEQQAAADCILRVLLDLYKNGNVVPKIVVPCNAFDGIASNLENHDFSRSHSYQERAQLALYLQADNGSATTLYYTK